MSQMLRAVTEFVPSYCVAQFGLLSRQAVEGIVKETTTASCKRSEQSFSLFQVGCVEPSANHP
jgi:hypothetical protein